jgi:hypothetical protein
LIAGVLSSAIGLCQYFGVADLFAPFMSAAGLGEAYGNLRQRNQLATVTNIGVASLFWALVRHWRRLAPNASGAWPLTALGALGLLVAANAATSSRIGLVQLLALLFLAAFWNSPQRKKLTATAGLAVLLYCISAALLPFLLNHFWGVAGANAFTRLVNQEGCSSRRVLWSNVMQLVAEQPWTGWGWGNLDYAHYATLYDGERFCDILDNAHNLVLHLAVELGLPLAALITTGMLLLIVKAAPWRATRPRHQLAWSILTLIALHSMVEYPLWYGPFQIASALCVVLLLPSRVLRAMRRLKGADPLRRMAAGTAVAVLAYAGWDYGRVSQIYLPPEERSANYREDTLLKIDDSWLFRNQARFAELTLTPLQAANAAHIAALAKELLHYSPEPRVIEKAIESAAMLGRTDEAVWHAQRYRAAFPKEYAQWALAGSASGLAAQRPIP